MEENQPHIYWHALDAHRAAELLGTSPERGLSRAEQGRRLLEHGPNALAEARRRSPLSIFLSQFKDLMIAILLAAALVSGLLGEVVDAAAIAVIVALNAAIGFVQEYRAEKAMRSLRELSAPEARVVRDGERLRVPAETLVPGDLVLLEAGDIVPADLRLTEAHSLKAVEAALTGESAHVIKTMNPVAEEEAPVGDRLSMAFKGTFVCSGRGAGIVVATGMETEVGRITGLLREPEEKTPLEIRLTAFGRRLSYIVLAAAAVVFAAGLARGEPPLLMFMTAVSLAVAAIPEALPAVITVTLAIGAYKMAMKKALVRRLSAVETLGSVTYICADKTGTLTRGEMAVAEASAGEDHGLFYTAMALNNDASDPTETALLSAAAAAGYDRDALEERYPRVGEAPFEAERKLMSTLHRRQDGGYLMFVKGATEAVADISGGSGALAAEAEKASSGGLRVIAYAYKRLDESPDDPLAEEARGGFIFLGYAGLADPMRDEAAGAVEECRMAGITTVMITGDHPATAARIAGGLGMYAAGGGLVTGPELSAMSDEEFIDRVEGIRVYARAAPEQKYRIVRALQAKGHFVAMTGDGVNDAPALKKADIGVAMGKGGTEVAREASDLVLLDDNFATIVNAVREGRRIYDNIRKFIRYMLSSNSGEVWTIFLAPFFGLPLPLLPVQILWVNLVTDGPPAIALAFEKEEKNLMRLPPRPPDEGVFSRGMGFGILWVGLLMAALCISVQAWAYAGGRKSWQSMVFTVLCLSQMANVLALRSESDSVFRMGFFRNPPLIASVALVFLLQLAVLYLPALNAVFKTTPLTPFELCLSIALSASVFLAVEAEKAFRRKNLT